jgi:hypothetical protein
MPPPAKPTVEVRLPKSDWVKTVKSVKDTAKTGYDWDGDFLQAGRLVDLRPGTLVIDTSDVGSRKHPLKDVDLRIVDDDGKLIWVGGIQSNEWAIRLRGKAREYLDLQPRERIRKAMEEALANEQPPEPGSYLNILRTRKAAGWSDAHPVAVENLERDLANEENAYAKKKEDFEARHEGYRQKLAAMGDKPAGKMAPSPEPAITKPAATTPPSAKPTKGFETKNTALSRQAARDIRDVLADPPKQASTPAMQDTVAGFVRARLKANSFLQPSFKEAYEDLKSKHPDATLDQFHDALLKLAKARKIKLDPFTSPSHSLKDRVHPFWLDGEIKNYLDLGTDSGLALHSEQAILTAVRRIHQRTTHA